MAMWKWINVLDIFSKNHAKQVHLNVAIVKLTISFWVNY